MDNSLGCINECWLLWNRLQLSTITCHWDSKNQFQEQNDESRWSDYLEIRSPEGKLLSRRIPVNVDIHVAGHIDIFGRLSNSHSSAHNSYRQIKSCFCIYRFDPIKSREINNAVTNKQSKNINVVRPKLSLPSYVLAIVKSNAIAWTFGIQVKL